MEDKKRSLMVRVFMVVLGLMMIIPMFASMIGTRSAPVSPQAYKTYIQQYFDVLNKEFAALPDSERTDALKSCLQAQTNVPTQGDMLASQDLTQFAKKTLIKCRTDAVAEPK